MGVTTAEMSEERKKALGADSAALSSQLLARPALTEKPVARLLHVLTLIFFTIIITIRILLCHQIKLIWINPIKPRMLLRQNEEVKEGFYIQ